MDKSAFIQRFSLVTVSLLLMAGSAVQSQTLSATQAGFTTASPIAIYAHDVAKAMRRAETGMPSFEDR